VIRAVALAGVLAILCMAGNPPACEKPVCHMKNCKSYDKHGKPNGSLCSNDCSKACCRCAQSCNRH
jgi:hypothetical protein